MSRGGVLNRAGGALSERNPSALPPILTRTMKAPRAIFLAPLALLGACGTVLPEVLSCPDVNSPAVEVQVRDARTGAPAAHSVLATAQDGRYTDTLRHSGWSGPASDSTTALVVNGAIERPGTYTVRISKPGYRPWERTEVRARKGGCGVLTERLEALLEPAA